MNVCVRLGEFSITRMQAYLIFGVGTTIPPIKLKKIHETLDFLQLG